MSKVDLPLSALVLAHLADFLHPSARLRLADVKLPPGLTQGPDSELVLRLLVPSTRHLLSSWIYSLPYQLVFRLSDLFCYDVHKMSCLQAHLNNHPLPGVNTSALAQMSGSPHPIAAYTCG